jgi:hypothetical protein
MTWPYAPANLFVERPEHKLWTKCERQRILIGAQNRVPSEHRILALRDLPVDRIALVENAVDRNEFDILLLTRSSKRKRPVARLDPRSRV